MTSAHIRTFFPGEELKAFRSRLLVIVESPYAGDVDANVTYARRALRDCLERGEAPIASHLLYTQPGVLDDTVPEQRALGIAAGLAWRNVLGTARAAWAAWEARAWVDAAEKKL